VVSRPRREPQYIYNFVSSQLTIVQLYPPVGLYQLAVLTETY
jgi:hypothetical protein